MDDERRDEELELPEERIEDLEPGAESDDVEGGRKVPGNLKFNNIVLKSSEGP